MCTTTDAAQTTLTMDETAHRQAKRFLDDTWCTEHAHVLRPQAEAILGELVTVAVAHGTPPVHVAIECDGTSATISVSDADVEGALLLQGPDRPVMLVDVLSDEWGVQTRPGSKTVWSRLIAA